MMKELLPPANKVCGGYVFTGVCLSIGRWGVCIEGGVESWMGGVCIRRGLDRPPPESDATGYGQPAGCTHPTGLHSRLLNYWMCFSCCRES